MLDVRSVRLDESLPVRRILPHIAKIRLSTQCEVDDHYEYNTLVFIV